MMSKVRRKIQTVRVASIQLDWQPTSAPGVFYKLLRSDRDTGAQTILLKFNAGAQFPAHNHPGGEEIFVIEGEIQVGRDTDRRRLSLHHRQRESTRIKTRRAALCW